MMVPVPMITPSTVRNERILCSRTVVKRQADRGRSSIRVMIAPSSFHPQRLNRIELGGALRRIDSEEQPDRGGQSHAQQHR